MPGERFSEEQRWVLALAAAGSFMSALDAQVVTTALATIRADLSASIGMLQWTVSAYSLSFACLLMLCAALGDRFGRRRMYIAGLLLFAASSAACALAPSMAWLVAGRAAQGVACALMVPLAMALIGAVVTPAQRPRAMGIFSGVTGLAVFSGPVLGGALVSALSWHWIFWINLPIALLVAVLTLRHVRESRASAVAIDRPGALLLTLALLGLVWSLTQGNEAGWRSSEVLWPLVGGVCAATAFIMWERRAENAMVPPRLFASPIFRAGNLVWILLSASLLGTLFFMAQFFQTVQHASPWLAGVRMLPWTATLFIVAPVAGNLASRVGERLPAALGLAAQAVGLVWMSALTSPGQSDLALTLAQIVAGAGISTAMPAVQSAVLGAVAGRDVGKASGVFNTSRQLGWAAGVAAAVAVFSRFGALADPVAFGHGFCAVLLLSAALSTAGAVLALRLGGVDRTPAAVNPQGETS